MEDSPIGSHTPEVGPESQRRDERDSLFVLAKLRPEGDPAEPATVRVRNVSSGGLMADASEGYRQGMRVEVTLENIGTMVGTVAWAEAGRIGVAFDHPIDKARARKAVKPGAAKTPDPLYRTPVGGYRRPPIKPR